MNNQTILQIERALRKVSEKLAGFYENPPYTDLLLQVNPESGELRIYNDNDEELTRCVVEAWIESKDEIFFETAEALLRREIEDNKALCEKFNLLKPYSLVMIDDDKETLAELLYVDDDTIVLDGNLMEGLSDDLDAFWEKLAAK